MTTAAQKRMKAAVAFLQGYMADYAQQAEYANYSDATYIDDVLYGLGVSLDKAEHSNALGYQRFRAKLRAHLNAEVRA